MRVVIIDDEPEVARTLADSVSEQGFVADVALSGSEGLALIEAEVPDVVFLDVAMPKVSGIEVLREIRRRYPSVPVILITGRAVPEQIAEARQLGVTDVIEKPWALRYLDEALQGLAPG